MRPFCYLGKKEFSNVFTGVSSWHKWTTINNEEIANRNFESVECIVYRRASETVIFLKEWLILIENHLKLLSLLDFGLRVILKNKQVQMQVSLQRVYKLWSYQIIDTTKVSIPL